MASLYKREPFWWIRLTGKESEILKKPERFSTGLKNKRHSELLLKEIKEQIIIDQHQEVFTKKPKTQILFSQVLGMYVEHKKNEGEALTELTLSIYNKALRYFQMALPDKIVTSYTKEDYNLFINTMSELSQNSKAFYSTRIYALFRYLEREDYITKNNFRTVKEETKKYNYITHEQMSKFIEEIHGSKYYDRIMLTLIGAFRASEALSIRPENVKDGFIEIKGKGAKYAAIPIIGEMEEYLSKDPDLESVISYDAISTYVRKISGRLGFRINMHDLRKYQLSRLANAGVNIFSVKNYARHSDVKTTLKYYAKADLKDMRNEIDSKISTMAVTI